MALSELGMSLGSGIVSTAGIRLWAGFLCSNGDRFTVGMGSGTTAEMSCGILFFEFASVFHFVGTDFCGAMGLFNRMSPIDPTAKRLGSPSGGGAELTREGAYWKGVEIPGIWFDSQPQLGPWGDSQPHDGPRSEQFVEALSH